MTTIKSYTDIEQSKVLAKILPLESADMEYILEQWIDEKTHRHKERYYEIPVVKVEDNCPLQQITHPCWSLAALVGALPRPSLHQDRDLKWFCDAEPNRLYFSRHYGNPIDACYEMILKLNEMETL